MLLVRFSSAEKASDNPMLRRRSPELSFDSSVGTFDNENLSSDSRDKAFDESMEVSDNCVRTHDSCIRTLDVEIPPISWMRVERAPDLPVHRDWYNPRRRDATLGSRVHQIGALAARATGA